MPNPFALIDRLELDFELPAAPHPLARADRWFNGLSEIQRIGVALLTMLFLAASAFYCLGLGSTVLVNRAEAELIAQEAALAASLPTVEPTMVEEVAPTATPVAIPTPTLRSTARPTQIADYPTPIPAQLLPTIPLQPGQQRQAAPAQAAPPRLVAPPEPPTPTPPVRSAAPAVRPGSAGSGTTGPGSTGATATPGRVILPTPALGAPVIRPGGTTPAPGATRPPGQTAPATAVPVTRPGPPSGITPVAKPTSGPVINPFPSTPTPRPGTR